MDKDYTSTLFPYRGEGTTSFPSGPLRSPPGARLRVSTVGEKSSFPTWTPLSSSGSSPRMSCSSRWHKQFLHTFLSKEATRITIWLIDEMQKYRFVTNSGLTLIRPPLGPSQSVLIRGVASFQGWICTIQWTPSDPTTLGTKSECPD